MRSRKSFITKPLNLVINVCITNKSKVKQGSARCKVHPTTQQVNNKSNKEKTLHKLTVES